MEITNGLFYGSTTPQYREFIDSLVEGDKVTVDGGDLTFTGKVVKSLTALYVGKITVHTMIRNPHGDPVWNVNGITVVEAAPRTPEWAGAQVLRSEYSGGLRLLKTDGTYTDEFGGSLSRLGDHYTAIVDADGRIPVDSVLKVNGVTQEDLIRTVAGDHMNSSGYWRVIVNNILTTLGGKK